MRIRRGVTKMENKQSNKNSRENVRHLPRVTYNNKAKGQYPHLPPVVHNDSQTYVSLCYTFTTVNVSLLNKYFICLELLTMTKLMTDYVLQLPLVVRNSHIYRCDIYYTFTTVILSTRAYLLPVAFSDRVETGITTTVTLLETIYNIQYMLFVSS